MPNERDRQEMRPRGQSAELHKAAAPSPSVRLAYFLDGGARPSQGLPSDGALRANLAPRGVGGADRRRSRRQIGTSWRGARAATGGQASTCRRRPPLRPTGPAGRGRGQDGGGSQACRPSGCRRQAGRADDAAGPPHAPVVTRSRATLPPSPGGADARSSSRTARSPRSART